MKPETLQALKDSIAHWERMRDDRKCGETPTGKDCPLCQRFLNFAGGGEKWCKGCPVHTHTRGCHCDETPFWWAADQFDRPSEKNWRVAAQAEIDFLKSLLPEGAQ